MFSVFYMFISLFTLDSYIFIMNEISDYFVELLKTLHLTVHDIKYIIIFIILTWFAINQYSYYRTIPPGPWGIPLLGYLPFMNDEPHSWYLKKSEQYGDIFSVQMGSNLLVCIGSAKLLKELFYRTDSTARPNTPLNNLLGGYGIVLSEGMLWKKQRQFLHDKFRALGVKLCPNQRFEKFILMEIEELLQKLETSKGEALDPMIPLGRHMHNVILQLMMSYRFEENDEEFEMFNERVTRGMKLFGSVHVGEHVKHYLKLPGKQAVIKEIKRNLTDICKFHSDRVELRKKERDAAIAWQEPADLLDHYLERIEIEQKVATDDSSTIFPNTKPENQIVQVMNDLFSAGMETSRTSLAWCLVMMIREPEIALKVREELKKVVKPGQLITLEMRYKLAYIEAVIFETLRRASVVPLGTTHVNTNTWVVGNYTIPAGTHIVPLINKMNQDPEQFPEPEKFKPERFLKDNQILVPENFTQFGVGQRMCLGNQLARMELFLFFANLMNNFEFHVPEGCDIPGLKGVLGSTHAPLPFEVCFKKIHY